MPRPSLSMPFILFFVTVAISAHGAASDADKQDHQIRLAVILSLIPVVVAFSFIVFIFYRAKRESHFKQKQAEFRLSTAELEMKALRAQINPHFIFNCLNSIHHFMHQHDAQQAGDYLLRFSQLIRYALETSSSHMVSLHDDLEALKSYIELERLRLQSSFDYRINTDALAGAHDIQVPPMMIQPFVENSIWHGLNTKASGGYISINFSKSDDMMQCIVEDNGSKPAEKNPNHVMLDIKKTSMGIALIRERLATVNQIYNCNAAFTVEDRMNDAVPHGGTRVTILLPFED